MPDEIKDGIEWVQMPHRDGAPAGYVETEPCCARCGGSAEKVRCLTCHGRGWVDDDDDEDPFYDSSDPCMDCSTFGGWWHCAETPEHCQANPLPGREHIESTALSAEAWRDAE